MTLYRVASDSKVVEALLRAAENGKEVDVLVELRARFDEENNISWSRRLEDAGCRILYGLDKLKVHSKLCLITKKQDDHIYYYTPDWYRELQRKDFPAVYRFLPDDGAPGDRRGSE